MATARNGVSRRAAIKTALKAGAYAAPVVAAVSVPFAVGAQLVSNRPVPTATPIPTATPLPGPTGLILTNVVNIPNPPLGSGINVAINVVNLGPGVATNIVVSFVVPPGFIFSGDGFTGGNFNGTTFTIPSLAVGGGASLTLVYVVRASGTLVATLTATTPNPNPGISSASSTVTVT